MATYTTKITPTMKQLSFEIDPSEALDARNLDLFALAPEIEENWITQIEMTNE